MNATLSSRLSTWLLRKLPGVMPPRRCEWALAMQYEAEALPDNGSRLTFAVGCFQTAITERMKDMESVAKAGHGLMLVFICAIVALLAYNVAVFMPDSPQVAIVFAVMGAAYLACAFNGMMKGPRGLIVGAAALYILSFAASGILQISAMMHTAPENLPFYAALAAEGMAMWGGFALVSIALLYFSGQLRIT